MLVLQIVAQIAELFRAVHEKDSQPISRLYELGNKTYPFGNPNRDLIKINFPAISLGTDVNIGVLGRIEESMAPSH